MTTSRATAAQPARQAALRVLLIEDSEADADLVLALLEDDLSTATVDVCRTLERARLRLATPYDVVLADLTLPDAEGLAVVHAVLQHAPRPALLVLTGRDDRALALTALAAGAQDYLVKGQYDGQRLATAILHAVQRCQSDRAARHYERLAGSLFDGLEAPTCAVNSCGDIVAVNAAWLAYGQDNDGDPERCGTSRNYLDACSAGACDENGMIARDIGEGLRQVLVGASQRFVRDYPCHSPAEERWYSVRIAPLELDDGPGAVVMHVDVTDMHQAQEALSHQALHDGLTGLPNRLLLADRLTQALSDASRRATQVAVAFLDLDHFKRVNDSLGHPSGDRLLQQVAARLTSQLRAGDTLARFSGDEFVVVWRDLTDAGQGEVLSRRLSAALAAPFDVGDATVAVSASIGVAVGSSPQSADELLLAADSAMYDAKDRGRARVRVFSSELQHEAAERLTIEVGLRKAIVRNELVVHYQPVVDLQSGRPVAVEALVRWQHPTRGLVPPDSFIPVAESSGLIIPLGRWVLDRACRDAAAWTGELADLDVAVNLSVRQLTQPDVLMQVRQALAESGLSADRLMLEVTESAVMEDAEAARIALDALTGLGVRVAIDDFGTGYSSLLYLRRYPINALKVDRAFVSGIGMSGDDTAIVNSVVSLAHAVGATSIAEGVETTEQFAALREIGCRQAQGYLFSRPVPLDKLPAALLACLEQQSPATSAAAVPVRPDTTSRIFELHAQGASLHTIAAALNREGAPHPQQLRWHSRSVARVIGAHPDSGLLNVQPLRRPAPP